MDISLSLSLPCVSSKVKRWRSTSLLSLPERDGHTDASLTLIYRDACQDYKSESRAISTSRCVRCHRRVERREEKRTPTEDFQQVRGDLFVVVHAGVDARKVLLHGEKFQIQSIAGELF